MFRTCVVLALKPCKKKMKKNLDLKIHHFINWYLSMREMIPNKINRYICWYLIWTVDKLNDLFGISNCEGILWRLHPLYWFKYVYMHVVGVNIGSKLLVQESIVIPILFWLNFKVIFIWDSAARYKEVSVVWSSCECYLKVHPWYAECFVFEWIAR